MAARGRSATGPRKSARSASIASRSALPGRSRCSAGPIVAGVRVRVRSAGRDPRLSPPSSPRGGARGISFLRQCPRQSWRGFSRPRHLSLRAATAARIDSPFSARRGVSSALRRPSDEGFPGRSGVWREDSGNHFAPRCRRGSRVLCRPHRHRNPFARAHPHAQGGLGAGGIRALSRRPGHGTGSCLVSLAQSAVNSSGTCKRLIGLTRHDNVHAVILVGYPDVSFLRAAPRESVPVAEARP